MAFNDPLIFFLQKLTNKMAKDVGGIKEL